jgi:hypothetical protein
MTRAEKIIKLKLGLLALAKELGNISLAFNRMWYSRDTYALNKEYIASLIQIGKERGNQCLIFAKQAKRI